MGARVEVLAESIVTTEKHMEECILPDIKQEIKEEKAKRKKKVWREEGAEHQLAVPACKIEEMEEESVNKENKSKTKDTVSPAPVSASVNRTSALDIFPKEFQYSLTEYEKESYTLRVALQNEKEADSWVRAFERTSATRWCVSRKYPNATRIILHKYWNCHLSDKNLSSSTKMTKKLGCSASLDIKIKKITCCTKQRDKFLQKDPPQGATVRLKLTHNHIENSPLDMRLLRPSVETVAQFYAYFNDGLSPAEAIHLHESKIAMSENLANATLNPTPSYVYRIYKKWRNKNVGQPTRQLQKTKEMIDVS